MFFSGIHPFPRSQSCHPIRQKIVRRNLMVFILLPQIRTADGIYCVISALYYTLGVLSMAASIAASLSSQLSQQPSPEALASVAKNTSTVSCPTSRSQRYRSASRIISIIKSAFCFFTQPMKSLFIFRRSSPHGCSITSIPFRCS